MSEEHSRSTEGSAAANRSRNDLVERTRPLWSARRVAEALGLQEEELERAVTLCEVLALQTGDGTLLFPVWQFERVEGRTRVRPGLLPVLSGLRRHDQWAVAVLLRMEAPELGGRTALAVASSNPGSADLKALVRQVDREWSAGWEYEQDDVRKILAGDASYDDADRRTQAHVRQVWAKRAEFMRGSLDLDAEFTAQGRSWSEVDEDGNVVKRPEATNDDPHT